MKNIEERIKQLETTLEVVLRLIAKSPSSSLAKFVQEGLTGRKEDVLTLISEGKCTQKGLSKALDVSGSAIRKYIAECNMAFREFMGMEDSHIELIENAGRGKGWRTSMLGDILLSIQERMNGEL